MFLYDSKTTGGSHYSDHITEVAATVIVLENVSIATTEFPSLCHTSKHIAIFGNQTSCLDLFFPTQFPRNVRSQHKCCLVNLLSQWCLRNS